MTGCKAPQADVYAERLTFYLGTHRPHWLWRAGFPLFVSHRQLAQRRSMRPAVCQWALDSGGFTELSLHGRWVTCAEDYAAAVTVYVERIGGLDFAAPQDWMCEPFMIQRTGLSVTEHLHRTVENYMTLRQLAPGLPFIPVVQGWNLADYLACVELYRSAGSTWRHCLGSGWGRCADASPPPRSP